MPSFFCFRFQAFCSWCVLPQEKRAKIEGEGETLARKEKRIDKTKRRQNPPCLIIIVPMTRVLCVAGQKIGLVQAATCHTCYFLSSCFLVLAWVPSDVQCGCRRRREKSPCGVEKSSVVPSDLVQFFIQRRRVDCGMRWLCATFAHARGRARANSFSVLIRQPLFWFVPLLSMGSRSKVQGCSILWGCYEKTSDNVVSSVRDGHEVEDGKIQNTRAGWRQNGRKGGCWWRIVRCLVLRARKFHPSLASTATVSRVGEETEKGGRALSHGVRSGEFHFMTRRCANASPRFPA